MRAPICWIALLLCSAAVAQEDTGENPRHQVHNHGNGITRLAMGLQDR